jgi:hypothetical protein
MLFSMPQIFAARSQLKISFYCQTYFSLPTNTAKGNIHHDGVTLFSEHRQEQLRNISLITESGIQYWQRRNLQIPFFCRDKGMMLQSWPTATSTVLL